MSRILNSRVGALTCLIELRVEGVQVQKQIYSVGSKGTHACVVIESRVYMIDTDGVGPQVCHRGSIERALSCVGERVEGGKLVRDACSRCQRYIPVK